MRKVWLLLLTEAAGWKNRKNMIWMIVLIIIMISTISYVRRQEENTAVAGKITLGVANEDTSEYAGLLLQYFRENEEFLQYVELVEESEQKLIEALAAEELDAYLAIPKNFAKSMIRMENLPIRAVVSRKNPTKALVLRHVMEAYETYIEAVEVNCTALYRCMREEGFSTEERDAANMEISLELIFTALGKDDFFRRRMLESEVSTVSLLEHYKYTVAYFIMLLCFLPAGLRILALKENGLSRRLSVVNVSRGTQYVVVGLPYLVFSTVVLLVLCAVEGKTSLLLQCLLLIVPWLVMLLLLGGACDTSGTYLFVCSIVFVLLLVLGGGLIPEEYLPEQFLTITKWMPNRWFVRLMAGLWEV